MNRPRGTGSIKTLDDGKHLLRWRQSGQRPSRVVRGTREHAEQVLDGILRNLQRQGDTGGGATVVTWGPTYLDWYELSGGRDGRRGRAGAAYRNRFKNHLQSAPFADWPLDDVEPQHVTCWIDELRRRGLSPTSVRHCAYLLSAIYRHAIGRGKASRNPVRDVRKPKANRSRRDIVLTAKQIGKLKSGRSVHDDAMRVVALVLVGTMLRPGELLGLDEGDVDYRSAAPHLQVKRSGRGSDTLKNSDAIRRVDLFGLGLEAVRYFMTRIRPGLKVRGRKPKSERWAFPIPAGWLRTDERGRLGAVLRAVDAGDVHAHDLRGTGATHLLSGTWGEPWTIAEVAALLGDTVEVTQKNYAHVIPSRLRLVADRTGIGERLGNGQKLRRRRSAAFSAVGHEGLEPSANGLRVHCSTN